MDFIFLAHLLGVLILLPYFIFAIIIAFYIPGKLILRKYTNNIFPNSLIGRSVLIIVTGMVSWTIQGVILGYLNLRHASYIYIIVLAFIYVRKFGIPKLRLRKTRLDLIFLIILFFGVVGQVQQFVITGVEFKRGIYTLTPTFDDAFWHTGLIESITRTFPPIEPGIVGLQVHNYHYWSNVLIAEIGRVFSFPILPLQYIFFYLFASILLGLCAYSFGVLFKLGKVATLILIYLHYFAADVIYLTSFLETGKFVFNVHPLLDGSMFLENPPRAFSVLIAFGGIFLLSGFIKTRSRYLGILTAIVFGVVIGFKVHTGLLVLSGLCGLSLYFLYKKRFSDIFMPILAFIISFVIYAPVNLAAGGVVMVPFMMTRNFAGQVALGISHYEQAREIYAAHNNILQSIRMDLTMLFIFMISQFGLANLGFLVSRGVIKVLSVPIWLFLITGAVSLIFVGTIFIQPVAAADIFNAYLSAVSFLTLIAGVLISSIAKRCSSRVLILIILLIFALTIPRYLYRISNIKLYWSELKPVFTSSELKALKFLKESNTDHLTVLVFNDGQWDSHYSYVSYFSNTNTFLSGMVISGRHGVNTDSRKKIVEKIKKSNDPILVKKLLSENNIFYLYFYGNDTMEIDPASIGYRRIYKSDNTIYEKN